MRKGDLIIRIFKYTMAARYIAKPRTRRSQKPSQSLSLLALSRAGEIIALSCSMCLFHFSLLQQATFPVSTTTPS